MGTFHAVRNPAHHSIGDGEPVTSFEDLAALSKVARWIEDWRVDRYFEPDDVTGLASPSVILPRKLNVSAPRTWRSSTRGVAEDLALVD
jgi:hypothetical protein